jgi:hypothetical protein
MEPQNLKINKSEQFSGLNVGSHNIEKERLPRITTIPDEDIHPQGRGFPQTSPGGFSVNNGTAFNSRTHDGMGDCLHDDIGYERRILNRSVPLAENGHNRSGIP